MSLRGVLFAFDAGALASADGRDTIANCFARYRLGVVSVSDASGTGPDVQAEFARHDLHRYFETWATASDVGVDGRRVVRAALGAMGVQPGQAAVVTSDPAASAAAIAAGCHVVVVGTTGPTLVRADRACVVVADLGGVADGLVELAR